jgi:AraC-like DNA-binding protein
MKKKSQGDVTALQERVMRWIRENACDPNICATTVSNKFSITEKRAYEIVRVVTGMSFSEYLLMLRMKAAGRLLYSTQLSVAEVAHRCGYPAESTFFRVFRKYHGISPSQYRKNGVLEEN